MTTEIVSISPVQGEPVQVHEMREIVSQFAGRVMSTIVGYSEQAEEIKRLREEMNGINERVNKLNDEKQELYQRIESLSGQLGVVVNERDEARRTIEGLQGELHYLRTVNEESHATITNLEQANSELVRQKADAVYRVKEQDDELDHMTGVNLEHESTIINLKKELEQLKTDHYRLSDEHRDLQFVTGELRNHNETLIKDLDTEQSSATFWKDACDKAEAKYWTLEKEIGAVRQSLNDLQHINDNALDQLENWKRRAETSEGVLGAIQKAVNGVTLAIAA